MSVKFKFFKITSEEAVSDIAVVRAGRQARQVALISLIKEFGADEIQVFDELGVECFKFPEGVEPDAAVWKKAKGGYLPRAKTKEAEKLRALPDCESFQSVLRRWGMGNEMVMGGQAARGTRMYRSVLVGSFKNNFFYVKVPYNGEYDKPTPEGLEEIKEWEAIKGVNDGE